jgi:branched-chain amino acid transport system permease protein
MLGTKRNPAKWIIIIAVAGVLCALPQIVTTQYYLHLIVVSMIWIVLTSGLNIIQGYAGYVSLCQVAFYGLGAYCSGLMTIKLGTPLALNMVGAVALGLVIGTIIGIPTLRTKGHYFSITTLAFTLLVYIVMKNWYEVTGGEHGFAVPALKESIFGLPLGSRDGYYYLALICAASSLIFVYRLINSKTGRAIVSLRENENLAQAVGINTVMVKVLAFNTCAVMGCIAGVLYAHYMNYVNPSTFAAGIGMNAILAVMVGGSGTVIGPVIGSLVVVFLPEVLRVADIYRQLVFGVVMIAIVFVMPKGVVSPIVGLIERAKERRRVSVEDEVQSNAV